jgi:hypothetical protein
MFQVLYSAKQAKKKTTYDHNFLADIETLTLTGTLDWGI